jgi:hypothetical protein
MQPHELLTQIDACRSGTDDLREPELAALAEHLSESPEDQELFDRVQKLDRVISTVLHDVSVPSGLADRLLKTLAESAAVQPPAASQDPVPIPLRSSRRTWPAVGVIVIAASLFVGIAVTLWRPAPAMTENDVVAAISTFYDQEHPEQLQPLRMRPEGLPPSRRVRLDLQTKWRPVDNFLGLGVSAVAYEIPTGGSTATLYVSRLPVQYRFITPSPNPQATAGRAISTWHEGELVYVLIAPSAEYHKLVVPLRVT